MFFVEPIRLQLVNHMQPTLSQKKKSLHSLLNILNNTTIFYPVEWLSLSYSTVNIVQLQKKALAPLTCHFEPWCKAIGHNVHRHTKKNLFLFLFMTQFRIIYLLDFPKKQNKKLFVMLPPSTVTLEITDYFLPRLPNYYYIFTVVE